MNVQKVLLTGTKPEYTLIPKGEGETFYNDGTTIIHIRNKGEEEAVVTIPTPVKYSGLDLEDLAITIPSGEERFVGTFARKDFNDNNNQVLVLCDKGEVEIALLK